MAGGNPPQTIALHDAVLLALSHLRAGRRAEAESLCRQILLAHPDQPHALHLSGLIALQAGDAAGAIRLIRRAVGLAPAVAGFHNDLGNILAGQGRLDEAAAAYRQVIALRPGEAAVHVNLSAVLVQQGRPEEAMAECGRALELQPGLAAAHAARGNILFRQARFDGAAAAFLQAVEIEPNQAAFHNNLASALQCAGRIAEAIASCQRAVALQPDLVTADSNRIFMLHFSPAYDARSILREQRQWAARHAPPTLRIERPHTNDRSPGRRLKIGYVCPDFRDHILGRYLVPILREHDRSAFDIVFYSDTPARDAINAEFRTLAGTWRDTGGVDDAGLAHQVRADGIDILIDTALHMSGSRLLTFARKPAPVQITFAGYPGGTGLEAIDCRLTDPHLDPPGAGDDAYVERSVRLPDTFWCYDTAGAHPPVNALPAQANGFITFGCLNNFAKVNEDVLALWAKVMRAVPRSKMLVLAPGGASRTLAAERMQHFGVAPDRLEFVAHQPREAYLATYHRIDIGLDTFPYNGHMTSLDALWMGVPVVTLVGGTAVGRAGWSQLSNLGLTHLAALDAGHFVEIAIALAGDVSGLAELRRGLRERVLHSPLTDAPRFTRGIERAYRDAWVRWCISR